MRWRTLSEDERKRAHSARVAEIKRKRETFYKWFAWFPVSITSGYGEYRQTRTVWLETIERMDEIMSSGSVWRSHYRFPEKAPE